RIAPGLSCFRDAGCRSVVRLERQRAAGGGRAAYRLEAPALDRVERLAVEHARRTGAQDAGIGDRAVGADGDLDQHLAGSARAQRVGRIARGRRADRAQRRRGGRLRRGGGLRGGAGVGFALGRGLTLGFLALAFAARGFLAFGQFAGGGGLGGLLLGQALLLDLLLGAVLGVALGPLGLVLGAARGHLHAVADALLQPRQRRGRGVHLLDQGHQPLRLVEVLAGQALLGGDQGVGLQVGQRTLHRGVVGQLVAQRQVVLHRVVAGRRVHAVLAQRGAG